MDVLAELRKELAELEARGLRRVLPPIEELAGPRLRLRGRWLLNLSSNDYLGLAQRMDLEEISREVGSTGAGASRLLSGNHPLYQRLEEKLVALYGRPALVFSSGYTANLAILSTLCGAKDVVFADKLVHASLIDGLRLSGAAFHRYAHLDLDHLERLLARHRSRYKRALIVTESVFSMDGDVPDLARLVELKERYQALLFVDEAHAVGVFGKEGLGIAEELSLIPQIDLLLATFGKALGSYGAFLVTHPEIRDYLVTKARPFIFTTGLPPLVVAASLRGLEEAVRAGARRRHLRDLSRWFRGALGLPSEGLAAETPIVPYVVGENERALQLSARLAEAGFYAPAIRPPTVPPGTARLRFSLTADLSPRDLEPLVELLRKEG